MNAPTRKRFDETWSRTFYPQTIPSKTSSPPGRSRPEAAHALELEEHGIAERAAGPGRDMNVPFTVVEEKRGQRFILWTYDANRVVEGADGYEAHVPLSHVSKYLHAVNRECGSTRDFSDGDGNWWQLPRLPIGHSCAPELMYTLASTTAGHPDYVDGKHAVSSEVLVHVWVDNIRYAGPRNLVLKATSYPDALAAEARITSKAADTRNAACRYEFLGVDWKHSDEESAANFMIFWIGRIDVLEIMFAEVAGFDLQHLLAVLLMLESKDALSVNKAVAKVVPGFVVPPPGPRPKEDASSKSFGEATTQQQLQQILMQQQRQQEMMMQRLQQVQQELQTVKAQAAAWPPAPQQHWPEEKCRLFLRSSGRRASASRPARDFEFDEAGICWLHGGRNRRGQAAPLLVHETTAARGELAQTSDDPMERAAAKVECARAKKWECTSAIRRQR
ncbi:hypothetical protein DIPPA_15842 [Diplonema papillatum]|nr:hypothetical protein DIPPA_15842 [Diplonema papillatum]